MKKILSIVLVLVGFTTQAFATAPKGYKDCSCPGKTERCLKTVKCTECCKGGSGSGTNYSDFGDANVVAPVTTSGPKASGGTAVQAVGH